MGSLSCLRCYQRSLPPRLFGPANWSHPQFFGTAVGDSAPIWGYLSERVGRKPVLLTALCIAGLAWCALSIIVSWRTNGLIGSELTLTLFFTVRMLQMVSAAGLLPAVQACIADTTTRRPNGRNGSYGRRVRVWRYRGGRTGVVGWWQQYCTGVRAGLRRAQPWVRCAPPGAVVFETHPIPFAVRTPIEDFDDADKLGVGIAIWFGCDDADELHAHLCQHDVPIAFPPKDGPFGRYFAFVDPFGYTITAHTVPKK